MSTTNNQPATRGAPPAPAAGSLAAWWQATRPQSLNATLSPVAVGIALAALGGVFEPLWAALTLLAALLLQIGTNMVNEYYDDKRGVDANSQHSLSQVIRRGLLTPRAVIRGAMVCFGLGAMLGVALALHGGPLIWLLGVVGILIGVFYTAGPYPLAYLGLGEVGVFVAMGPGLVLGTYIVQTGTWSAEAILAGVPLGLLSAAILHANNLRDIDSDRLENKRTLAARFGRTFARREYSVLVFGTYLAVAALGLINPLLALAGLGTLLTVPAALRLNRIAHSTAAPAELNQVLRGTAALHGQFGLLWAAGLLLLILVRG
ncbi:MAG: 1,4-dihydroxy-2-naphthoate polyprenyltransferase [Roseiflexaceae bacterium]